MLERSSTDEWTKLTQQRRKETFKNLFTRMFSMIPAGLYTELGVRKSTLVVRLV